jgi:hypothetical protein
MALVDLRHTAFLPQRLVISCRKWDMGHVGFLDSAKTGDLVSICLLEWSPTIPVLNEIFAFSMTIEFL